MSTKNHDFRNQYAVDMTRSKAIEDFNNSCNIPNIDNVRQFMYQFMAILGLELEAKFPNLVSFDDNHFILFGREKSKKSVEDKKKDNIKIFNQKFDNALANGENVPSEVRPIFDLFAFKLVCPSVQETPPIINKVILDILNDIQSNNPNLAGHIQNMINHLDTNREAIIDFIDTNFSDYYPGIKERIQIILDEEENCKSIQDFIDENALIDVSTLTYSEYTSKILDAFEKMIHLSYVESYEEYTRILGMAMDEQSDFSYLERSGKSKKLISEDDIDLYSRNFNDIFDKLLMKKTNRLDLAVGDLMAFDVLSTSQAIKDIGASYSHDPSRSKHKRNSVGYVSEFYSFDFVTPDNNAPKKISSYAELQLQGLFRYLYGESGPAAHKNMPSGNKKRTFVDQPENSSGFEDWAKAQFMSLPHYFKYLGHGLVQVYSTLENFQRYYDTEDPEKVKAYVRYIANHDVSLLNGRILPFSLNSSIPSIRRESLSNDKSISNTNESSGINNIENR